MLKNYFKIALRNIRRNISYSLINIVGLAIAIACIMIMILWVEDELSYDNFHSDENDIYRITTSMEANGNKVIAPTCPRPLGEAIRENSSGVICTSTFQSYSKIVVRYKTKIFYETNVSGADSSFFKIFSFKFVKGSPETALRDPYSIVITQSTAKKYFGAKNPLDEDIEIDGVMHIVTAVIKDVPPQSHIQFGFLTSSQIMEKYNSPLNWGSINYPCYVLVKKNTNNNDIVVNMNNLIENHVPELVANIKMHCDLQPLSDIHLNTQYSYEYAEVTDIKTIYIFISVAFFVLLIACFNFINLSTAMASDRVKEIGLRKVAGSNKRQLFFQFIGECVFFTAIATLIAVSLVELSLPVFNQLYHKTLQINFFSLKYTLGIIGLILSIGILAGSYPAVYLSSFSPTQILKGNSKKSARGVIFRKALISIQFSISIGLIICATILSQQIHFLLNKELGFEKNNIIYIPVNGKVAENYQVIKNELLENRYISNVSSKDYLPTVTWNITTDIDWEGNNNNGNIKIQEHECGYEYFTTLNIYFVKGRNFSKEHSTDAEHAYILNEEAVKQLGLDSPIGKSFELHGRAGEIIGVVKTAYFQSLENKIVPKVYSVLTDFSKHSDNIIFIKYKADEFEKLQDIIKSIENTVLKYNPGYPFEFNFLDEKIQQNYAQVAQFNTTIKYLTSFAVLTAFLGLFGLTLFTIRKRTAEIGIRKVLGAPVLSVVTLVSKEFTYLIMLANLIAYPLAYFFMNRWLQDYAYRIDINWWVFIISGGMVLLIAIATISFQAIKAATANPVESLKYE